MRSSEQDPAITFSNVCVCVCVCIYACMAQWYNNINNNNNDRAETDKKTGLTLRRHERRAAENGESALKARVWGFGGCIFVGSLHLRFLYYYCYYYYCYIEAAAALTCTLLCSISTRYTGWLVSTKSKSFRIMREKCLCCDFHGVSIIAEIYVQVILENGQSFFWDCSTRFGKSWTRHCQNFNYVDRKKIIQPLKTLLYHSLALTLLEVLVNKFSI